MFLKIMDHLRFCWLKKLLITDGLRKDIQSILELQFVNSLFVKPMQVSLRLRLDKLILFSIDVSRFGYFRPIVIIYVL